jgi:excisionase family DNA binding protein
MASNSDHAAGELRANGQARLSRFDPQGDGVSLTCADLLTADEVAELLQLRPSTVQDYARRGIIPSFKLGRFRRFVRTDVEATLELLRESGSYPSAS